VESIWEEKPLAVQVVTVSTNREDSWIKQHQAAMKKLLRTDGDLEGEGELEGERESSTQSSDGDDTDGDLEGEREGEISRERGRVRGRVKMAYPAEAAANPSTRDPA
jgi:hypothetical protein